MRRDLSNEDGWALTTAILLMAIMATIGMSAMAFVDTETRSSHRERVGEARLNLTEGALAAQIFQLSRRWPDSSGRAYPSSCTETSTAAPCPSPTQLKTQFKAVDVAVSPAWDLRVRDDVDGPSQYYSDAEVLARPTWDQNQDGEMWIRAAGLVNGIPRVVVARVRVEKRAVIHPPPGGPFVAGSFRTGNEGSTVLVSTAPNTTGVVRCATTASTCIDYKAGQLSPVNSVKSDASAGPNLTPELVESLRQIAQASGRYYATGCPADPSGDVVFVESGHCSYNNSSPVNPVNGDTKRGIFVVANGTLSVSGNITWWGAVYALNQQGCGTIASATCIHAANGDKDVSVQITGTVVLRGGVYIDGGGRLAVGSSGNAGNGGMPNLIYDPTVVGNVTAYGNAGVIQNTWRELTAG